jgi:hypothetical protein
MTLIETAYWTIMSATGQSQPNTSWEDADRLIRDLRGRGIAYLVGDEASADQKDVDEREQPSNVELIQRLAQCSYPRVRDASISLFLLHPELVPDILQAIQESEPEVRQQIATVVLATLYLQRLWSIQLILALGHPPNFPEAPFASLWQSRHLPPPAYHNGAWGLQMLQAAEQERSGLPLNYQGDWQNQVDHLLLQERASRSNGIIPSTFFSKVVLDNEQDAEEMSMRPDVDRGRIEQFLKNLGGIYRKPGRVYLVGGAALVHAGLRPGATQDIDLEIRATNEDELSEAIRRLKDSMKINVEFANLADFIPLPPQWETRAKFIGRYGSIDAFYFDFYSIALSKIQRGNTRDIDDVKLLLQNGYIDLPGLDAAYRAVLPQVGKRPYIRLDPQQFAARYTTIRRLL